MSNIALKIGVKAGKEKVMAALDTLEGLAGWWTWDVSGDPGEGGTLAFRFHGQGPDMKVLSVTDHSVHWQCIAGHEQWLGTEIKFTVKDEGESAIYFQHLNWQDESGFYALCSMKWATFMLSLKQYLDQGSGHPFPDDIQINTL
ncbi:SRPBCC domain-containing protein [Thalassomonas haliotis]|uniref:SRPBCC domain-containing protein n=1 Tax=Thalassomonas haliotis TaxID=485448 RepID=A0ABY7VL34_9GAMM|nr:SRPBCC domain-containing protein [Thalassomonas haliotis]WDE13705.1 SRPBCC domain-containing protein [Thalassomonas haliotis]